ncbi:MAG: JAB domain-containing protein [Ignavibacteriaceae bacterium]|nr:JAB domain-containing protein [Ignavibacteriaceae bacterium]
MRENIIRFKTLVWKFKDTHISYDELTEMPKKKISSPRDFFELFQPIFKEEPVEIFVVAWLSSANRIIGFEKVSVGNINSSIVDPRSVFRSAIVSNSASIIVAHNHPSGNQEPSDEDISITKKLVESGKLLGVHVFDHIIFAEDSYTSFVERRLI